MLQFKANSGGPEEPGLLLPYCPRTLSGMSVCRSSSLISFKDPLGELQALLKYQGSSGNWPVANSRASLCPSQSLLQTCCSQAFHPLPSGVDLPLSSAHLAKSYLTLKEPSGNSSPPLRYPAQNRSRGTAPSATATRVAWTVCFLTKRSCLRLCIPRALRSAWHLLGECLKFCAE